MTPLHCQGCGAEIPGDSPAPFRCPNAGTDGGDHVVGRSLAASAVFPLDGDPNPFVRYRALTHAHALALSRGMSDEAFVAMVRELDAAVARAGGHGFAITPFQSWEIGSLGFVHVKDETGNVSGSHKGRHLMGLAILGEVHARTGIAGAGGRLAIASCGNAALAAAVIARAWGRPLDVFIPVDANPRVVAELTRLGAEIHVCPRTEGVPGDPCYHAFRAAVAGGALPFCCQGSDNGLTVEGGQTIAWEMASALVAAGPNPDREGGDRSRSERAGKLDRLFVQVGGGALASACVQGFQEAARLGAPVAVPRLHPVQTRGAFPLRRAWERVVARLAARLGIDPGAGDAVVAERLRGHAGSKEMEEELAHAARHRAEFMWPWETEPRSVAHGILDDETYDWLAVVRGTLETGGFPVVVEEEDLLTANAVGREWTGIDVDPTGSSGLAGLVALWKSGGADRGGLSASQRRAAGLQDLRASGVLGEDERVGVLFTGVKR